MPLDSPQPLPTVVADQEVRLMAAVPNGLHRLEAGKQNEGNVTCSNAPCHPVAHVVSTNCCARGGGHFLHELGNEFKAHAHIAHCGIVPGLDRTPKPALIVVEPEPEARSISKLGCAPASLTTSSCCHCSPFSQVLIRLQTLHVLHH